MASDIADTLRTVGFDSRDLYYALQRTLDRYLNARTGAPVATREPVKCHPARVELPSPGYIDSLLFRFPDDQRAGVARSVLGNAWSDETDPLWRNETELKKCEVLLRQLAENLSVYDQIRAGEELAKRAVEFESSTQQGAFLRRIEKESSDENAINTINADVG